MITYTPRKISAWFEISHSNYNRELTELFHVMRTAQHGNEKQCKKLLRRLK